MHKIFSIAAIVPAILGAISIGYMYYGLWLEGFSGPDGMTILAFQLIGLMLSVAGFGLSGIALMIANRKAETTYPFNDFILILSLFSLAALILGLIFL